VVAGACAAVALACGPKLRRLDEAPLLATPAFELKLVRYYENLPLHFTGEIAVVQCRSAATRDAPAGPTNDAGWQPLGRVTALGSKSAAEVVETARRDYEPIGAHGLAWKGTVLQLSFDGCGSFVTWDPTTLGADQIDPIPKPDYCAPVGAGDCRYHDFEGARRPTYTEIEATPDGAVAFVARSLAFRGVESLRVASADGGRTWQVTRR
jgi:hypothetical protein